MKAEFTVPGQPIGKQRPRFSRAGAGIRTYTPAKTANYENLVKLEYERQCGNMWFDTDRPLEIRISAYFQVPKSASRKKRQAMLDGAIRPAGPVDIDNLCKIVLDGLQGVAFANDSQVAELYGCKFYSEEPKVMVTVCEAPDHERR